MVGAGFFYGALALVSLLALCAVMAVRLPPTAATFRDGDGEAAEARTVPPVRPQLFVAFECDRPTAGAARYDLEAVDEVIVGRGDERTARRDSAGGERQLVVNVPGRSMSARHARILRTPDGWVCEDLGSTNGSYINGRRISTTDLRDADVLELGHTIFLLRSAMPTPPGTPDRHEVTPQDALDPGFATVLPHHAVKLAAIARLAASGISLLLLGETGTGKEVLARSLHARSGREGAFVAVNCGALPDSLVESQLFGHVRGAFSGATRDEPGLVRASHGGTLFLDEIGDLPKSSQAALLRVLQEREVMPVGGTRAVKVDLRVIAATHRPLKDLVAKGAFRADLYGRLAGFVTVLLPLRQRQEDIGLIVGSLLSTTVGPRPRAFAPDVGRALFTYRWPLNVRELQQMLASSALLATDGVVERSHLPDSITGQAAAQVAIASDPSADRRDLGEVDAQLLDELTAQLKAHRGNVAGAARAMGKAPMQLHRWMKRFGVDPSRFRR
jgi:transcriptional regulator with AAA-type ATPase domain